jgi:hypothetical protein
VNVGEPWTVANGIKKLQRFKHTKNGRLNIFENYNFYRLVQLSSRRVWSYSEREEMKMMAFTLSKQWIHWIYIYKKILKEFNTFFLSDLWPPTSMTLKVSPFNSNRTSVIPVVWISVTFRKKFQAKEKCDK